MRLILVLALCLAGCAGSPDILTPPPAPTSTLDVVGAKEDKLESRTAAAVQTAHNNADKPEVVRSETSVALAGLPKPSAGDLAYAEARASKSDPKAYEASIASSAKAKADIDKLWEGMESERKANQVAMSKMTSEIDTLRKQVDEAKKEGQRNLYAMVAAGMMVLGGFAVAFGRVMIGAGLLLSGLTIGSVPFLLDTPWFLPAVGAIVILSVIVGAWHFLRKPTPTDETKV
jgi:hypothetical protein